MKKKVYAYLHTHWDREWYREFEEFKVRLVEVFDDVLDKLEKNEIPSFYFDGQTAALQDYIEIRPEKQDFIKKLIKDKRLFIGPYYCSTDSFLVDSESLIKNLQMGISYSKAFGCHDYIAYHADTFGHSAHIPQIVKYFDINNAIFWRGLGELESEFLFNDLKSIYLIEGYFHDYFSAQISYEKKAEFLKRTLDRIAKYSSDNMLLPLGADHLAAPDNIKEQIKEVNKLLDDYEIVLSTPFEYLDKVQDNYKKNIRHEFRDTKRNFILPGVYSSRIDLKQQNAKLQWLLSRKLQPLQAIESFCEWGRCFQKETDSAFKELIKNHPHDSIYGCSVDNVHKENVMRFKKASEASHAILNSIKRDLYNNSHLSIINLSNFDLKGAFRIKTHNKLDKKYKAQLIGKSKGFPLKKLYDINQIPVTEDFTTIYEYLIELKKVKAFSSKKINEYDIQKQSFLKITEKSIENSNIKLEIKNGKIILTDKISGKVLRDFITIIDRKDDGDSYNFGAVKGDKPLNLVITGSKIIENANVRSKLQINALLYKTPVKIFALLENQNDFIEFNIEWNNKTKNHIMQVEFGLPEPCKEVFSDDLAGYIKRKFDTDYDIYKEIPAPRGIELPLNTAPFQKCLWLQGIGVITEGLQEYEVFKNKLRLTLLRATGTISNPKNPTRGTPAGPPLPTPDLQMLGHNSARFAVCFKNNIEACESNIEKFYDTALLCNADLSDCVFFETGCDSVLVNTVKLNDNGDLIVRLLNKADSSNTLKFRSALKNSGLYFTNAMEEITDEYKDTNIEANSFVTILLKK